MLYFFLSHYSSTQCFSALFEQAKDEVAKRVDGCVDENSLAMRRAQEVQAKLSLEFPSRVKFMLHSHYCWILLVSPHDNISWVFQVILASSYRQIITALSQMIGSAKRIRHFSFAKPRYCYCFGGWRLGILLESYLIAGDVLVFQLIEHFKIKVTSLALHKSTIANSLSVFLWFDFSFNT